MQDLGEKMAHQRSGSTSRSTAQRCDKELTVCSSDDSEEAILKARLVGGLKRLGTAYIKVCRELATRINQNH